MKKIIAVLAVVAIMATTLALSGCKNNDGEDKIKNVATDKETTVLTVSPRNTGDAEYSPAY